MSRGRGAANRRLPRNLYYRHGYYSYKDPADGREYGMGRDKWCAVSEALNRNARAEGKLVSLPAAMSAKAIVAAALACADMSGLYFLIDQHEIVYVGQSKLVHRRLAQHFDRREIQFDRYFILPCPVALLDLLEARYIAEFRPAWNTRLLVKAADL